MASASPGQTPPQAALQMDLGHLDGGVGAGPDHLQDRLRLGQVDPAGEKGAQGELSRLGQPGPLLQDQGQDSRQHPVAGVAVDLHHVLPGVGVGGLHPGEEHFVDDFPLGVDDVSQIEPVGAPGLAGLVRDGRSSGRWRPPPGR